VASLLSDIPLEFINPSRKYALMNYLVNLGLPQRITRQILTEWGAALGVDVTSTDYDLLNNHSLITPGPPAPPAE